ncbi:MAG: hypothetical protein M0037_08125 [Betaproteobacteria bacterium]|nr:hypothetical protein [Betaproteobacteria bacterium]
MLDEDAYQDARAAHARCPCIFERALLRGCAQCDASARHLLAEREVVACAAPQAQARCAALRQHLLENALFALKLTHSASALPYAKEIKVQCGGLQGLQLALSPDAPGAPINIQGLVSQALERYHELRLLPFPDILKALARFEPRPRR